MKVNNEKNKKSISYAAYQQMAELYATIVNTKPFNAYYERPATLSLMPEVAGMQVLDAGCGAGFYAKWFADHQVDVIALDFSENMIAYTKELLNGAGQCLVTDLNEPLSMISDAQMDLINSSLTIHYLADIDFTFSEFARVLKPDGYFIFSIHHPGITAEWHELDDYHQTVLVTDTWKGMKNTQVSYYHRSLMAYTEALRKNGFLIEQILEPMPEECVKELSPHSYQVLTTRPTFLFIKARLHTI